MARKTSNVEFLIKLKEISGYSNYRTFAEACGKHPANMNDYLNARKSPGKTVLRTCLESLYGWEVDPLMEIAKIPENLNSLPAKAGVYVIYDSGAQVLYVGKATNFRSRVSSSLNKEIPVKMRFGPRLENKHYKIKDLATHISLYAIASPRLRHNFEVLLLRGFANQTHNNNIGSFK